MYDSTPALIGGLYAEREGFFRPFTEFVFQRFFLLPMLTAAENVELPTTPLRGPLAMV